MPSVNRGRMATIYKYLEKLEDSVPPIDRRDAESLSS
jgi:hypothetical protein